MQLLDMSFDFITALHDFEELFGPTARSIMLCYVGKSMMGLFARGRTKNAFQKSELSDQMSEQFKLET